MKTLSTKFTLIVLSLFMLGGCMNYTVEAKERLLDMLGGQRFDGLTFSEDGKILTDDKGNTYYYDEESSTDDTGVYKDKDGNIVEFDNVDGNGGSYTEKDSTGEVTGGGDFNFNDDTDDDDSDNDNDNPDDTPSVDNTTVDDVIAKYYTAFGNSTFQISDPYYQGPTTIQYVNGNLETMICNKGRNLYSNFDGYGVDDNDYIYISGTIDHCSSGGRARVFLKFDATSVDNITSSTKMLLVLESYLASVSGLSAEIGRYEQMHTSNYEKYLKSSSGIWNINP